MAFRDRRPLNRELFKTGLQRHEHRSMVTDDALRGTPLGDRLAEDLAQPREVLPVEAARPDDRPAIAVEDQDTIEPVAVVLDELSQIDKPDLVRRRGVLRTLVRIRQAFLARCRRIGLFVECDHLPDGCMAVPIPEGVQRHLHPVVPEERGIDFPFHSMHQKHREESMYNPDHQRMRGRRSEFCTINRSHPWRQFTDIPHRSTEDYFHVSVKTDDEPGSRDAG